MITIELPPNIAILCQKMETACEAECCGIAAFDFSPFNVIPHLTYRGAKFSSGADGIQSDLDALRTYVQTSMPSDEKMVLEPLNAILSVRQMIVLIDEIGWALSRARKIYAREQERLENRNWKFMQKIKAMN